jgi:DNA-binding IclR family transcriptional regulator
MEQREQSLNSVEKALHVLLAFHAERPEWGVRELGAHLGFSPATVQRLLRILKDYAFVDQDPDTRQYRLGNIYFQFLHVLQSTYPVIKAAKPVMENLIACTQETVHLNIIEGMERLCIDSIESPQKLRGSMPAGERSPLYAGASAKCLLAFSPQSFINEYLNKMQIVPLTDKTIVEPTDIEKELLSVRRQGYASSLGERTPGLASLSAPVFDHNGLLLAALSLGIPELRFRDEQHSRHCLKALLECAGILSRTMGYSGLYPKSATKRIGNGELSEAVKRH